MFDGDVHVADREDAVRFAGGDIPSGFTLSSGSNELVARTSRIMPGKLSRGETVEYLQTTTTSVLPFQYVKGGVVSRPACDEPPATASGQALALQRPVPAAQHTYAPVEVFPRAPQWRCILATSTQFPSRVVHKPSSPGTCEPRGCLPAGGYLARVDGRECKEL